MPRMNNRSGGGGNHNHNNPHSSSPGSYSNNSPGSGQMPAAPPPPPPPPPPQQQQQQQPQQQQQQQQPPQQQPPPTPLPSGGPPPPQLHHFHHHHHSQGGYGGNSSSDGSPMMMDNLPRGGPIYPGSGNNPPPPHMQGGGGGQHQMQNNNNNNGNWGMSQNARYPPTPGPQGGPNGGNNMPGPGMQQQPQQQQMVPPPMMRHGPMNNNQHQQPPQGGYYNHGGDYPPPPPPMSGGSNYYSPPPPPPGPYNNNNGGNMSPPPPNGSFRGGGGGPPMPMDSSYAQPLRSPHMGYSGGGGGGGPMDMNAPPQSPPPPGGYNNNNNVRGQVGNHQQNHSGNQQHHNMMHGGGPGPQSMQGGPRPGYHPNNNNGPNNSAPYHNNNNNNGNPSPPSVQGSSTNNPSVGNNNSNMNANSNPNVRSGGMSSSPMPGPMNNNNMGGNHPPMSNYNGMPLPPPPPPMQQQQQQQQQQMQQGMGPMGPPTPNNNHNMLRMNQPNNSNNNMMGYGPMGGNGGGDGGWQQPSQPPVPLPRGAASGQGYHHNNNNNMQQGMMPMQQSMMPPQSGGRVGRNNGGSMHRNHRNNNNGGLNHHHSQHQSNNMNGPNMNGNMMNMMGPPAGMMTTPMPGPGGVPPNMPMGADGMHGMLPPGGFHTPQPPNLPTPNPAAEEVPIPPLLSLYDFLKDRMLLKEGRLSEFFPPGHDPVKDGPVHIAVDGNYMMTTIRSRLLQRDPLWFLHSPLPDQLLALVRENVEQMRAKNLEPIWVFNGIGVSGDVEAFLPSPKELQVRDAVWGKLNIGELPTHEEIAEAFDTSSSLGEDVLMAVQRFLRSEFGVLTVTSPFINWCQMITFLKEGDVQLVMGPAEMMMLPYEPMQVIAEIDLVGDAVAYFDRNEVLHRLFPHQIRGTDTSAAGDRMLDFGMLIATHPAISAARANLNLTTEAIYEELASGVPHYVSLRDFITQFEHGGPGASGVNGSSDRARTGSEVLKHSKGRTYLQYSPVFSKQCKEPVVYFKRVFDPNLTIKNMPNNLSGVFGNLVPLFLFFCQYCGLLSVSFMTIITQSYFRDDFPVSDTTNYHHHLPTLVALRGQILYQIVLKMTDSVYKQRLEKVSWVRWFDNILMVVARPAENITLDEWNVSTMEDLDTMELSDIHISKVLSLTNSVTCIPESQVPLRGVPNHQPIYRGTRQTYFAILLKVFDFLGYFSHAVVAPPVITARSDADGEESGEGPAASTSEPAGEAADSADATGATAGGADGGAVDEMDDDDRKPDNNTAFTVYLCRSLAQCPPEFQSALVRLTELVRVEIINSSPCCYISSNDESEQAQVSQTPEKPPVVVEKSPEAAEGEEDGKDDVAPDQHLLDNEDSPPVLLAARIATLVTVPYLDASGSDEMEWAPVYSRHLCAFSVMVRAMNRSLRELVEVISTSVFLTGLSDCPLMGCCDLLQALPFGDIPSAIGGLLLHYVLVFPADYENQCRSVEDRWEYLQAKFKHIPNLPAELKRVMEFTFQALFLLNAFCKYDPGAVTAEDLRNTYVVSDALHLLYSKWKLHIKEPAPEDIHNLWSPAS